MTILLLRENIVLRNKPQGQQLTKNPGREKAAQEAL